MNRLFTVARRLSNNAVIANRSFISVTKINMKVFSVNMNTRMMSQATEKVFPFLDEKMVGERIIEVVKNYEKVDHAKLTATSRFKEDLELDSLDAVEIVMIIEEEFCIEIPDSEADKILSISDAVT